MSSNAISATGELVNIDGYGNRVASLLWAEKCNCNCRAQQSGAESRYSYTSCEKSYVAPMTMLIFEQDYAFLDEFFKKCYLLCKINHSG
jgi:hypothetical protein